VDGCDSLSSDCFWKTSTIRSEKYLSHHPTFLAWPKADFKNPSQRSLKPRYSQHADAKVCDIQRAFTHSSIAL
jgi:hypothetical protein